MTTTYNPPWPARTTVRRMALAAQRGRGRNGSRRGGRSGGGFPMGGPGPFFRGRAKVSRGDVRLAILYLLSEEPMHGYQIMQELSERTGGVWSPSPGSIYPTLQQLEDEDLVQSEERDGKKVYRLTDAGAKEVDADDGGPPWESLGVDAELMELRDLAFQVGSAVMQVAHAGNEGQLASAKGILTDTRSRLYRLLADEPDTDTDTETDG